ncbi:MAG TPA: ketopantoate reductase C-terminal domain-containing protein [Spirochaetia bacterium]
MDITVIGPGAVGTLLGGLLQLKGHAVTLRGRKPPADTSRGLRVILPARWLLVEGINNEGPEGPPGAAQAHLVTLGRQHLHAVRRPDLLRIIGAEDTPVAVFNCDPAEPERLAIPTGRLRLCLSLMSAVKLQEGEVELTETKPHVIYERSKPLAKLFGDLSSFGFQSTPVDDARPYLNSLLVSQLLFLPAAMCNTTIPCFLASAQGRELARAMLGEGFAAMERAAMPLATLPAMDPVELMMRLEKKPDSFEEALLRPSRSYNSVLQAYLRGRPLEAEHLNKKVVEIASSAGLHLTWNWRILQKASRVASLGFYRDPAELLKALA